MKIYALLVGFICIADHFKCQEDGPNEMLSIITDGLADLGENTGYNDPDFEATTPELITSRGYPCETHYVETRDNYILAIHRIPNGNGYLGNNVQKPIIFIQHGMMASSADFVVNFKNTSLGFIMYDLGYDVWMGNFRGNMYSRNNSKISPEEAAFWKFSWDQTATIDLPTMLTTTLTHTKQKKLSLLAYSLGGASAVAMLSEMPEIQDKIHSVALMAPVSSLHYVANPLYLLLPFKNLLSLVSITGVNGEFMANTRKIRNMVKYFCTDPLLAMSCVKSFASITASQKYLNESRVPVYLSHYPAGTSSYTITHTFQLKQVGRPIFQKFDFGPHKNMAKYNQTNPPEYDLSRIDKAIIGLFTSDGDIFAVQKDVDFLRQRLKNRIETDYVIHDDFGHFDFYISPMAAEMVYGKMIEFWRKHQNE